MKKISLLLLIATLPAYGMQTGASKAKPQIVKAQSAKTKPVPVAKAAKQSTAPIVTKATISNKSSKQPTKKSERYVPQVNPALAKQSFPAVRTPQQELEKEIGYVFKKPSRLTKALTTESANKQKNYENYEFFGDSVLHLALTEILLKKKYPNSAPDSLTKARIVLEQNATLALLAEKLELSKYIIHGPKEYVDDVILSDVIEALIGAIYKDGGALAAQQFVERYWLPMLNNKTDFPKNLNGEHSVIFDWKKKTGGEYPLPKSGSKIKNIAQFRKDLSFAKTLPLEFQRQLPVFPIDSDYIVLDEKTTTMPSWQHDAALRNNRVKLHTIAQILQSKPNYIDPQQKISGFAAELTFLNLPKITSPACPSKTQAQEIAAQSALEQLSNLDNLPEKAKDFLKQIKVGPVKNARVCLKELADLLGQPSPQYVIPEADKKFSRLATFVGASELASINTDGAISTATRLDEAEELAAEILLKAWLQYISDNKDTIKNPIKYVDALTKYLSIKRFAYEQYTTERKLSDPARYYTKVLTKNNEFFVIGDAKPTVSEADESAARKALCNLLNTSVKA